RVIGRTRRTASHGARHVGACHHPRRSMRYSAVVALSLALMVGVARADLMTRALAAGESGAGADADLLSWAGAPQPITLPELLQLAVRQAPALQSARIDIAIAEAQIAETWARRDWH